MRPELPSICVVGLGYIGLPTASLLATKGFDVRGVDVKPEVVDTINGGGIHLSEPELDVLVRSAVQSGRLRAALEPGTADIFIIAVPTPFRDDLSADLSFIQQAAEAIAPWLEAGNLVILESTVPVGSTEQLAQWLHAARPDLASDVRVAHCPERVLPGRIIQELVANDRIVGGTDPRATDLASAFYRRFVSGEILATDARTAELSKLAENTFRDVNIALANEFSLICDRLGIDVWEMIGLANHHPRVNILQPGPGVGGHCIAVDPWFIIDSAPEQSRLIRTAREVNNAKPEHVVAEVERAAAAAAGQTPCIACFGLAYKPDIDDMRESPALRIVGELAARKRYRVLAVEPNVDEMPAQLAGSQVELADAETALAQADVAVILVKHREFVAIDWTRACRGTVVDTVGLTSKGS